MIKETPKLKPLIPDEIFESVITLLPIFCHFKPRKSLPHTKLFSITLKQHIGPIRWHRIEVTSPVLPFYLGLGYLPGTEYLPSYALTPARLCIDPGYAPIYYQFFAILSR